MAQTHHLSRARYAPRPDQDEWYTSLADIERELPDVTLLLDVYDSIIALAPENVAQQRAEQMRAIMCRARSWTGGLPIGAEGYVAGRLAK